MSARLMNALGASELVRTICATRRDRRRGQHARRLARGRPGASGRARATCSCWGWNPMSTAPHLWRLLLAARRNGARLVVVDPFRSRTARVADEHLRPLPGTDAALGAGDDARDRRRRPAGRGVVPRAHRRLRRAAGAAGRAPGRALGRAVRRAGGHDRARRPRVRDARSRRCCGSASAPSGTRARRSPTARSRACPRWRAPGAHVGGGCSYIPTATAAAIDARPPAARGPAAGAGARSVNMSQLGEALTDPALDPPVKALVVLELATRRQVAPDQDARAGRAAPRGPVHRRARAVHDRHRAPRRRGPAGDDAARAPRRACSRGATTTSRSTSRRSRRSGRRKPNTESVPRCWRRAWASTTRASARPTRSCSTRCSPARRRRHAERCASAAG